jgi:hypothetical protein
MQLFVLETKTDKANVKIQSFYEFSNSLDEWNFANGIVVGFVNSKAEQDENLKVLHSIPDFMCFNPQVPRIILTNSKGV